MKIIINPETKKRGMKMKKLLTGAEKPVKKDDYDLDREYIKLTRRYASYMRDFAKYEDKRIDYIESHPELQD